MSPRRPDPRARRPGRGRARAATLAAWLAAVPAVGGVVVPRVVVADEADRLREQLVGGDEAARAAAYKSLEGRPGQIGAVLGPLLRDPATPTPAAAAAAVWLALRPDATLLLRADVLGRGVTDPGFPRAVLAAAGDRPAAWARWAEAARRAVASPAADDPAATRRGAVAFAAADPDLRSTSFLVDAWAVAEPPAPEGLGRPSETALELAAAVRAALAFPFPSPAAARAWLDAHRDLPFLDAVRALAATKDTPAYPLYARMVAETKANLERITTLAALEPYLVKSRTPWPEVRQAAATQAGRVEGTSEQWRGVLTASLREEDDPTTLGSLLLVAAQLQESAPLKSPELAEAVVLRLRECCALPRVQQGLLELLGKVGDTKAVDEAFRAVGERPAPAVMIAWLQAAAAVGGLDEPICRVHQDLAGETDPARVAVRVQALESLGARRGAERAWTLDALAKAYLFGILRREDAVTATMPREEDPAARAAAIRSLVAFPDSDTFTRLGQLAASPPEDLDLARLAVSVLGRLAVKHAGAAGGLLALAADANHVEVRRAAIADLARAGTDLPADDRGAVELGARVRGFLKTLLEDAAAEPTLRVAAAEVAATLGDPALAAPMATLVVSVLDREDALRASAVAPLERLVIALAQTDASHDGELATVLARLSTAGGAAVAIPLADAAAEAGGARLALQTLRAGLRLARAKGAPAASDLRHGDLSEAERILRSSLPSSAPEGPDGQVWRLALATRADVAAQRIELPGLPADELRGAFFAGLEAAVALNEPGVLARAAPWAAKAKALPDLTDPERGILQAYDRLTATKSPPTPR